MKFTSFTWSTIFIFVEIVKKPDTAGEQFMLETGQTVELSLTPYPTDPNSAANLVGVELLSTRCGGNAIIGFPL